MVKKQNKKIGLLTWIFMIVAVVALILAIVSLSQANASVTGNAFWDIFSSKKTTAGCYKVGGYDINSPGSLKMNGQIAAQDSCIGTGTGAGAQLKMQEFYCEDGEMKSDIILCDIGCEDGACVEPSPKDNCVDSDYHDYYNRGYVTYMGGEPVYDACYGSADPETGYQPQVIERYCLGDQLYSEKINCDVGCQFGKCMESAGPAGDTMSAGGSSGSTTISESKFNEGLAEIYNKIEIVAKEKNPGVYAPSCEDRCSMQFYAGYAMCTAMWGGGGYNDMLKNCLGYNRCNELTCHSMCDGGDPHDCSYWFGL